MNRVVHRQRPTTGIPRAYHCIWRAYGTISFGTTDNTDRLRAKYLKFRPCTCVSLSAPTGVGSPGEPVEAVASDIGHTARISLHMECLRHHITQDDG